MAGYGGDYDFRKDCEDGGFVLEGCYPEVLMDHAHIIL